MSVLAGTGLGLLELSYVLAAILAAAFVRGYTGFGLSALIVTSVTLVLPPAEVVPIALVLEIAASVHMLPLVRKQVDWRILGWLSLTSFAAIPVVRDWPLC